MSPLGVGVASAALIFGGALLGMALARRLPPSHLSEDSKDAIKAGAGMVSLMAALVLGLLVSSAKSHFDSADEAMTAGGAKVILLDRALASYGAESQAVRESLRRAVAAGIEMMWPDEPGAESGLDAFERADAMERMLEAIRALEPRTDAQRALQAQAQQLGNELLLSRWLQIEQAQTSLPAGLLEVLLFWLTMLYVSFGLLAPRNATVVVVMLVGAASLATAVFLILEMNDPMGGVVQVSSGPLRKAFEHLGR
jgi:hypothetical protein